MTVARAGAADGEPRSRPSTFPRFRVERGAELLRVENVGRRGALSDITLLAARRRGARHRRAARRRPDRARARARRRRSAATTGRILVDGREVRFRDPADAIARGIGLLPEDRKAQGLVPGLTVARNIALPHGRRLARFGVLSRQCEAALAGADRRRSARQGHADAAGPAAERRQPAEGRARQVARRRRRASSSSTSRRAASTSAPRSRSTT